MRSSNQFRWFLRLIIPVVGIPTELDCSTKLKGLYACGEVACTGLHGANRLASNSLLEAVVMAHRGAEAVCAFLESRKKAKVSLPEWVGRGCSGFG
jgi:L-aspartate oxidase